MVLLSSKVIFARVRNVPLPRPKPRPFWTHPASVKRAWQLIKFFCSFIARFFTYMEVSPALSGHISCTFWTHLVLISDMCERYLGAELYHTTRHAHFVVLVYDRCPKTAWCLHWSVQLHNVCSMFLWYISTQKQPNCKKRCVVISTGNVCPGQASSLFLCQHTYILTLYTQFAH